MPKLVQNNSICSNCAIFPICFTVGLDQEELKKIDAVVISRMTFHKGDMLFDVGDKFSGIYVVRSGSFKVFTVLSNGEERIIEFCISGELLGFDAAEQQKHIYSSIALETSSVCKVSLEKLFQLATQIKSLQTQLFRLMSRELAQLSTINLNSTAEQKLVQFILNLSERLHRRGLLTTQIHLSMSREDISSYLGLASETISRLLKKLQQRNLIKVQNRNIELLDIPTLQKLEQGCVL